MSANPSSSVRHFTDPDDYATAIKAATVEMPVVGRGDFVVVHRRVVLETLSLSRLDESLPRIVHSSNLPGRTILHFRPDPGAGLVIDGVDLEPDAIHRYADAQTFHARTTGPISLSSIWFKNEDFAAVAGALGGDAVLSSGDAVRFNGPPGAIGRLKRLHAAAVHLAEHAPEIIANPTAARGMEQELVRAIVACLDRSTGISAPRADRARARIVQRFREVLDAHAAGPVHIPDLCKSLGVTDRTLRTHCQEALGLSPARYLWERRMHLAHRALLAADPATTTVTDIATAQGFWELGRFSVQYRGMFGESPSATLRRRFGARSHDTAVAPFSGSA